MMKGYKVSIKALGGQRIDCFTGYLKTREDAEKYAKCGQEEQQKLKNTQGKKFQLMQFMMKQMVLDTSKRAERLFLFFTDLTSLVN